MVITTVPNALTILWRSGVILICWHGRDREHTTTPLWSVTDSQEISNRSAFLLRVLPSESYSQTIRFPLELVEQSVPGSLCVHGRYRILIADQYGDVINGKLPQMQR